MPMPSEEDLELGRKFGLGPADVAFANWLEERPWRWVVAPMLICSPILVFVGLMVWDCLK